ncbi:MAG: TonB-dependent receptor [Sphingobacteriales bacterium]|nr:MAG: TonB-dependent receptor [Sphingobacteriales bacterium]
MKQFIFSIIVLLLANAVQAQHPLKFTVRDAHSNEALPGVTAQVKGTNITAVASDEGIVEFNNIPAGKQTILITTKEYKTITLQLQFPLTAAVPDVLMTETEDHEGHDHDQEEVVIASTRSSRTIQNMPTRVEFIAGEELEEKANMKPGDIRMVLAESTGVQTQQTSATSANSSIRIQGLDGRYTQILKDGFPLYSGAASGLGLLQIPPLDLKQVEIIKGSASTLYGGGAIAGLVNLISKTPGEERETRFHINGTSAKGLDVNGFYSQKFKKVGVTLFASRNSSEAYDPADNDMSAIPEYVRYVVNPRLFFYLDEKTKMDIALNSSFEKRTGGDMHYIKGEGDATHSFFEKNNTKRISTQFTLQHKFRDKTILTFKNSYSFYDRLTQTPFNIFDGQQKATFTEINLDMQGEKFEWIAGANLWTDDFKEKQTGAFPLRNYNMTTAGVFVQNTFNANKWLSIESGIRGDYVNDYGFAFLPRVNALIKYNNKLSSRVGAGLGYKAPTIFTEDAERLQYANVLAIDKDFNKLERSYGFNADVNYKTKIAGTVDFSINHLFFYTYLQNPLLLKPAGADYRFENISGHIDTRGMETNMKFAYNDFKLFLGYTFTVAEFHQGSVKTNSPLTAKHRINSVLMYEVEEKWKLGLEAYYFSKQQLSNGDFGRSYWVTGFMAEKLWEKFSLYINFENFLDARQSRYGPVYNGTISNPQFNEIYAPLDGFVINGGLKLRL